MSLIANVTADQILDSRESDGRRSGCVPFGLFLRAGRRFPAGAAGGPTRRGASRADKGVFSQRVVLKAVESHQYGIAEALTGGDAVDQIASTSDDISRTRRTDNKKNIRGQRQSGRVAARRKARRRVHKAAVSLPGRAGGRTVARADDNIVNGGRACRQRGGLQGIQGDAPLGFRVQRRLAAAWRSFTR